MINDAKDTAINVGVGEGGGDDEDNGSVGGSPTTDKDAKIFSSSKSCPRKRQKIGDVTVEAQRRQQSPLLSTLLGPDPGIKNCPRKSELVSQSVRKTMNFWMTNVIPHLKTKGRVESYARAVALSIARCCCIASGIDLQGSLTDLEKEYVNPCNDDFLIKSLRVLVERFHNVETVMSDYPGQKNEDRSAEEDCDLKFFQENNFRTEMSNVSTETIEYAKTTIANSVMKLIWGTLSKRPGVVASAPSLSHPNKFSKLIEFVNFWKKIADWYEKYPNHKERDAHMSSVASKALFSNTKIIKKKKIFNFSPMMLYPSNVDPREITTDYLVKLLLELILSPHIHIEWKIEMSLFVSARGPKMLSPFEEMINNSAKINSETIDTTARQHQANSNSGLLGPWPRCIFGNNMNSVSIQPCSALFWDFCRGGAPPCAVEYMMVFNEPSAHPALSTGSGLFGCFYDDDDRCDDGNNSNGSNRLSSTSCVKAACVASSTTLTDIPQKNSGGVKKRKIMSKKTSNNDDNNNNNNHYHQKTCCFLLLILLPKCCNLFVRQR